LKVVGTEFLAEIGNLRHQVWTYEQVAIPDFQHCRSNCWIEDLDFNPNTRHVAVFDGDRIIAAARISIHETFSSIPDAAFMGDLAERFVFPVASLNRMVVHPRYRHLGIGGAMDRKRLKIAKDLGARYAVAVAVGMSRCETLKKLEFAFHSMLPEG